MERDLVWRELDCLDGHFAVDIRPELQLYRRREAVDVFYLETVVFNKEVDVVDAYGVEDPFAAGDLDGYASGGEPECAPLENADELHGDVPDGFLADFLEKHNFSVPIVYNTSAYDDVQALEKLRGKVQIFLPDMKYSDNSLAKKYSSAPDYVPVAKEAIEKMYSLVGDCEYDENGMLKKGVIVRHLMLPNNAENTLGVIDWFEKFSRDKKVLFSLMRQYTPCGDLKKFPELERKLCDGEYEKAVNYLYLNGIEGFLQESESSSEVYIPQFSNNLDEQGD